MNLKEVVDLITVRNYIVNSLGNAAVDRKTVSVLNGMLILIDQKILTKLQSDEFKDYINYTNVKQAIEDVARITNIKSGLKK